MSDIAREPKEIKDQRDEALMFKAEARTEYPAMSYEEGVEAALAWVLGESDEPPIETVF